MRTGLVIAFVISFVNIAVNNEIMFAFLHLGLCAYASCTIRCVCVCACVCVCVHV